MKKITTCLVMALLCLKFYANGQENKPVDVTSKGIQIGQPVPDITINNIHNYKTKTAKISDFKGKLLILDFWATWCSPCVAMIPKMDSLQKEFGDKVQFLSVTYQTEKEAISFLEKFEKQQGKHYDLPMVTDSKELHRLFPHITLPHYIWIDRDGKVKAITDASYVNAKTIRDLQNNGSTNAKIKRDLFARHDVNKPLSNLNSENDTSILFRSNFSSYIEGIGMGYNKNTITIGGKMYEKITARNSTVKELFQYAYKKEAKEVVIEVDDSARFICKSYINEERLDWRKKGNSFCYELLLKTGTNLNSSTIMQRDLETFFSGYEAKIEKRKVQCLTLVRMPGFSKIPRVTGISTAKFTGFGGKITNCPLLVFIARMQFYLQKHPLPLADETDYSEWVDLDINANMSDLVEVNRELEKYRLRFVEKLSTIDMLVIKDKKMVSLSK